MPFTHSILLVGALHLLQFAHGTSDTIRTEVVVSNRDKAIPYTYGASYSRHYSNDVGGDDTPKASLYLLDHLLYHAAYIAQAIVENFEYVEVPDSFTFIARDSSKSIPISVPLHTFFNRKVFHDSIELISSNYQKSSKKLLTTTSKVTFVSPNKQETEGTSNTDSDNFLLDIVRNTALNPSHSTIMYEIIHKSFQPNAQLKLYLDEVLTFLSSKGESPLSTQSVCVISNDSIDVEQNPDIMSTDLFKNRGVTNETSYIYYSVPFKSPLIILRDRETNNFSTLKFLDKSNNYTMTQSGKQDVKSSLLQDLYHRSRIIFNNNDPLGVERDNYFSDRVVNELVDFFICKNSKIFISMDQEVKLDRSNISLNTFSAIQAAIRNGHGTYWYSVNTKNVQDSSIQTTNTYDKLSTLLWNNLPVPIVYTYTELSKESGKALLKASIRSVREHMSKNTVYVLYHGNKDVEFLRYLQEQYKVIVHNQTLNPIWKDDIEKMRLNGNNASSNLFLHSGNYFGTWQRIDIPLFVDSEYCLLLDSDTIMKKPFTINDFSQNVSDDPYHYVVGSLTDSIAMSAEFDMNYKEPWNAGVTLMNVPYLRKTYQEFISFITQPKHIESGMFEHPAPSDQGAYLAFYNATVQFLSISFNIKPYWKMSDDLYTNGYIIHYHGAKPHDYISTLIGNKCDTAIQFICDDMYNMNHLCQTIQEFAIALDNVTEYCSASYSESQHNQLLCIYILNTMISNDMYIRENRSHCDYFTDNFSKLILLKNESSLSSEIFNMNSKHTHNTAIAVQLRNITKFENFDSETDVEYISFNVIRSFLVLWFIYVVLMLGCLQSRRAECLALLRIVLSWSGIHVFAAKKNKPSKLKLNSIRRLSNNDDSFHETFSNSRTGSMTL